MKELFAALLDRLSRGEAAALCCVLASGGSAPRGAGAKMAVFSDGTAIGTVGGGAVEQAAIQKARAVLAGERAGSCRFSLSAGQIGDLGMICGGEVTVGFRLLTADDVPAVASICETLDAQTRAWLVFRLTDGEIDGISVQKDGEPSLLQAGPVYLPQDGWYAEPLVRAGTVYIAGAGHVGAALARLLPQLAFRTIVYDEREGLLNQSAYPDAKAVCGKFSDFTERLTITSDDYIVIMTPGHLADRTVLAQALTTDACYIGCIGSRRKIAATNEALRAAGVCEAQLARIHAPIGLEIFAETPQEIAVSVAAELIRHRAQRAGTRKAKRTEREKQ